LFAKLDAVQEEKGNIPLSYTEHLHANDRVWVLQAAYNY
jgi:hypothetical protein